MHDAMKVVCEMNQQAWRSFNDAVADLTADEIDWRPLPQANSINIIVRHLRIEAQWHLASLARGERMPSEISPAHQNDIDAVPLDFQGNVEELEELYTSFLELLRRTTLQQLQQRTITGYGAAAIAPALTHLLGYHQALHVTAHCGQIRMIRNLYRTSRGEPARFFPENPTYPR